MTLIARFFSPDPFVQAPDFSQNYNRYSYVMNNPLKYTDPSGEWIGVDDAIAFGIGFAGGYLYSGITSKNWGKDALINGLKWGATSWITYNLGPTAAFSINSMAVGHGTRFVASQVASSFLPSINIPVNRNTSLSLSPAVFFGSCRTGLGINFSVTSNYQGINVSVGLSANYYHANFANIPFEFVANWALGYDNGTFGLSYSSNHFFSGETSQNNGAIALRYNNASIMYQNDFMFGLPADGGDRFRTAAARIQIGELYAGVNLFTGDPGLDWDNDRNTSNIDGREHYVMGKGGQDPNKYRSGIFYVGYGNYRFGRNSERIRHIAQNRFAHDILMGGNSPYFTILPTHSPQYFYEFGQTFKYSLW